MKFLHSNSCVVNVLSVFPSRIVLSYPLHKVLQAFSHKLGVENFLHFILFLAVDEDCWGSRRDVARMRIARDSGQERDMEHWMDFHTGREVEAIRVFTDDLGHPEGTELLPVQFASRSLSTYVFGIQPYAVSYFINRSWDSMFIGV